MTAKSNRLLVIIGIGTLLSIAAILVLFALKDNIVFFYTPSEITESGRNSGKQMRLGGLVKDGSLHIDGMHSVFTVTDGSSNIIVRYSNALPSLFREGQGVVAEGKIKDGVFVAQTVLAKHDENYMPADVAKKLKDKGIWQDSSTE